MLKKVLIYIEKKIPETIIERIKRELEGEAEITVEIIRDRDAAVRKIEDMEDAEEKLIITDSGDAARSRGSREVPVVVYLHMDNRNEDFTEFIYVVEELEGLEYSYLQGVYDRIHKNPWQIFETERCIVREMTEDDTEAVYDIYSGASAARYMEKLPEEQESYTEYIRDYIENIYGYYEYGMWVIVEKLSGKVIGRVGFEWKSDLEGAELGYVIDENYQRCGFAYEVCCAAMDYVAEKFGLKTLYIVMSPENKPSEGLARKLGFVPDRMAVRQNENCQVYIYRCE